MVDVGGAPLCRELLIHHDLCTLLSREVELLKETLDFRASELRDAERRVKDVEQKLVDAQHRAETATDKAEKTHDRTEKGRAKQDAAKAQRKTITLAAEAEEARKNRAEVESTACQKQKMLLQVHKQVQRAVVVHIETHHLRAVLQVLQTPTRPLRDPDKAIEYVEACAFLMTRTDIRRKYFFELAAASGKKESVVSLHERHVMNAATLHEQLQKRRLVHMWARYALDRAELREGLVSWSEVRPNMKQLKGAVLLRAISAPDRVLDLLCQELSDLRRLRRLKRDEDFARMAVQAAEYALCRALAADKAMHHGDAKTCALRLIRASREVRRAEAQSRNIVDDVTQAANSFCRKECLRRHPDRIGEEHRHLFDELVLYWRLLTNGELRRKYFAEQMVQQDFDHVDWMTRHEQDIRACGKNVDVESVRGGRGAIARLRDMKAGKEIPLSLTEGGQGLQPKLPVLIRWCSTHSAILEFLASSQDQTLIGLAEFIEYEILSWRDLATGWRRGPRIPANALREGNAKVSSISGSVDFGDFGDFEIRWRLTFLSSALRNRENTTPWSHPLVVEHHDPTLKEARLHIEHAQAQAVTKYNELRLFVAKIQRKSKDEIRCDVEGLLENLQGLSGGVDRLEVQIEDAQEQAGISRVGSSVKKCNRGLRVRASEIAQELRIVSEKKLRRRGRPNTERGSEHERWPASHAAEGEEAMQTPAKEIVHNHFACNEEDFPVVHEGLSHVGSVGNAVAVGDPPPTSAVQTGSLTYERDCQESPPIHCPSSTGCRQRRWQQRALARQSQVESTHVTSSQPPAPGPVTPVALAPAALPRQPVPILQKESAVSRLESKEGELHEFLSQLDLSHYEDVLQGEEMFLDILRILSPKELDSSLRELNLPMGARRKILKALCDDVDASTMSPVYDGVTCHETEETIPHEFMCPITLEVMSDPVQAADGYTYERSAITEWLQGRKLSPVTNAPINSSLLVPNYALRSQISRLQTRTCGVDLIKAQTGKSKQHGEAYATLGTEA